MACLCTNALVWLSWAWSDSLTWSHSDSTPFQSIGWKRASISHSVVILYWCNLSTHLNLQHLPDLLTSTVKKNKKKTTTVKWIFSEQLKRFNAPTLIFSNSDIMCVCVPKHKNRMKYNISKTHTNKKHVWINAASGYLVFWTALNVSFITGSTIVCSALKHSEHKTYLLIFPVDFDMFQV